MCLSNIKSKRTFEIDINKILVSDSINVDFLSKKIDIKLQ